VRDQLIPFQAPISGTFWAQADSRKIPVVGKGRYPRKVITDSKLTKAINPCIDPSVKLRWDNDPSYRPLGLGNIEDQVIGR
jgi:hypothetical protein